MAIGALDLLVKILATHHLETVAINEFIGIKKSTLATALLPITGTMLWYPPRDTQYRGPSLLLTSVHVEQY